MAGRAGRRGKDRLGNVWNIVTRKHPPPLVRKYTVSQKIVAWLKGTCAKSSTDRGGGRQLFPQIARAIGVLTSNRRGPWLRL